MHERSWARALRDVRTVRGRAAEALKAEQDKADRAAEQAALTSLKPLPTVDIGLTVETFDGKPTLVRIGMLGRATQVDLQCAPRGKTIGQALDEAWPILLARACGL